MQTRWFTLLSGIPVLAILMLLLGQRPAVGKDDGDEGEQKTLAGIWDVTFQFPDTGACSGPSGAKALQQYQKGGSLVEVPSSPRRGPALGSWERNDDQFAVRSKFFIFNLGTGAPAGSEIVTSQITLTGPDSFTAAETFDVLDAAGNPTAQGCHRNATATRFE